VVAAFEKAGFTRTNGQIILIIGDDWICFWGLMLADNQKNLMKYQKNNHFPGCHNCGRKDKLWLHLQAQKRRFPNDYNFVPNTYLMQYDFERIKQVLQEADPTDIFIMKPVD
jgi:tubulin polyglutamylase TTLL4